MVLSSITESIVNETAHLVRTGGLPMIFALVLLGALAPVAQNELEPLVEEGRALHLPQRVGEPEEVVEAWPDIPILGYTNHTDKAGLQRAHSAGFDQVIVKSALVERALDLVAELAGSGATDTE